jgi:hypothetical protein
MNQEVPFSHLPPEGYFYSFEEYKSGVISIWLNNTRKFDYNLGKPTKTVGVFTTLKPISSLLQSTAKLSVKK